MVVVSSLSPSLVPLQINRIVFSLSRGSKFSFAFVWGAELSPKSAINGGCNITAQQREVIQHINQIVDGPAAMDEQDKEASALTRLFLPLIVRRQRIVS